MTLVSNILLFVMKFCVYVVNGCSREVVNKELWSCSHFRHGFLASSPFFPCRLFETVFLGISGGSMFQSALLERRRAKWCAGLMRTSSAFSTPNACADGFLVS